MPRVSFTATEPGNFEPLPAGRYHVRIDDAKWETAKTSSNQQVRLVMCVLDPGPHFERSVSEWLTHTEKAGWKFGELAEAALDPSQYEKTESGEKDEKGRPMYSYDFDTDDLPGSEMMVNATVEEDNKGNPRNRFRFIRREDAAGGAVTAEKGVPAEEAPTAEADDEAEPPRRRRAMQS